VSLDDDRFVDDVLSVAVSGQRGDGKRGSVSSGVLPSVEPDPLDHDREVVVEDELSSGVPSGRDEGKRGAVSALLDVDGPVLLDDDGTDDVLVVVRGERERSPVGADDGV
jgi:hypothetical protein